MDLTKNERFPVTKGQTFQIGQWGTQDNERADVPIWCLKYNGFTQKLLSIKYDNQVQIWNCSELIEKVQGLTESQLLEISNDFIQMEDPSKEFPAFEVNGLEPSAICGSWLPTDHNLFAVCFEGGHLVFFDVSKGTICHQHKLEGNDIEISSMVAHNLEPVVVLGLESGDLIVYDHRQQKQVDQKKSSDLDKEAKPEGAVQSIEFINNGLQLVVGYQKGMIGLFTFKTLDLVCLVNNVHISKGSEALNHLLALSANDASKQGRSDKPDTQEENKMQLPFFLSCGSDGRIKLFEYNSYAIKQDS